MVKKRKRQPDKWKRTLSITIEIQQQQDLQKLANYTGLNISEVVRELLPTEGELDAFMALQDFADRSQPKDVTKLIAKTRRLFMEVLMSGHPVFPIGLQVAAVSYFDETGSEIAKLFQNYIKALQSTKGYRFESEKFKFPKRTDILYFCLACGEKKKDVGKIVKKYLTLAPDAEVLETIGRTARTMKKPKTGKRISKTKN